jgi:hypothetical protein
MPALGQTTRILRIEVPVDDEWHIARVPSTPILHVNCRQANLVEFWIREAETSAEGVTAFRVYGTGQPTPASARYEGTAIAPGGRLVWHLLSVEAQP